MRMDAASAFTSVALIAGLGVVVASVSSNRPGVGKTVAEFRTIDLESVGQSIIAVNDSNFIVDTQASNLMVNPVSGATPVTVSAGKSGKGLAWVDVPSALYVVAGSQVNKYAEPDWGLLTKNSSTRSPSVRVFGGQRYIGSIAVAGPVLFVGCDSGQVFRVDGLDVVEQKVRGGEVTQLAVLDGLLLAVVGDVDDEGKASLYLLNTDDLSVVTSRERVKVDQLVPLAEGRFLVVDAKGLWVGRASKDGLSLKLEVEGAVRVSNNASDGYFVLSTKSVTSLMRLGASKLTNVKNLERGGMADAAINDEYVAVLSSSAPRGLKVYRFD